MTVACGPRVLVCTGGDEIRPTLTEDGDDTATELAYGQIYDANGPMLTSMLVEDGAVVRRISIGDDPELLIEHLRENMRLSHRILLSPPAGSATAIRGSAQCHRYGTVFGTANSA